MYFSATGEHPAGTAGRVVNSLDDVALVQVLLRDEQKVHHQSDYFARGEMFAGVLVGLLRTDSDQFFEGVAHLDVVDVFRRQVNSGESLDDLIEQVLFRHTRNLVVERETLHDLSYVRRVTVDVGVEVRGELVGVVQQFGEIQPREIVERSPSDRL